MAGYQWMNKKDEFSINALAVLPILSFNRQLFYSVENIAKTCVYWELLTAQTLYRLEERGWLTFGKRISNPKQMMGLDQTLYVALKERVDNLQRIKNGTIA